MIMMDYCQQARDFQAVPSHDQFMASHPGIDAHSAAFERSNTLYSCADNYTMGTVQDNQIYIATTDAQHNSIARGQHTQLSGYFSDQATVDASRSGGVLDNARYNEMCQIAPYRDGGVQGMGDASYKGHVDCFDIDRDRMQEVYGTRDFDAALSKCEANNQFGAGGGNQGYNPRVSEMIDNGCLQHNSAKSYSDLSVSNSPYNNPNQMTGSVVPEARADQMYNDAYVRANDCVQNQTPHPSLEARSNGFAPNPQPVQSPPGQSSYQSRSLGDDLHLEHDS